MMLEHDLIPEFVRELDLAKLWNDIEVISCDLGDDDLHQQLKSLARHGQFHIIHSAATTNLNQGEKAWSENYKINNQGSLSLLKACSLFAKKFTFVSTAYSCGRHKGLIPNEYSKLECYDFRNPYEEIKHKTENELAEQCHQLGIDFQIFRPGVVSGRLMEAPFHFVSKYNVFYAFSKLFYSLRSKGLHEHVRVAISKDSVLHITPVDFVAKVIVGGYRDSTITEMNIVPRHGVSIEYLTHQLMTGVGYTDFSLVETLPEARNFCEKQFQKLICPSFLAYMTDEASEFDNSLLIEKFPDLEIHDIQDHLPALVDYAVANRFLPIENTYLRPQNSH